MKLVLFGASGTTGRHIARAAVDRGHHLVAFGRSPARLPTQNARLRHAIGDVRDLEAVAQAVAGADGVICALGTPPSDRSGLRGEGTATILRAMEAHGVARLVCMSCLGVGDSYDALDWFTRRLVLDLWLWRVVADHAVQEALVRQSDRAWTIVRPPHLSHRDTGQVEVLTDARQAPRFMQVGRGDLAAFLVEAVEGEDHLCQEVTVAAA